MQSLMPFMKNQKSNKILYIFLNQTSQWNDSLYLRDEMNRFNHNIKFKTPPTNQPTYKSTFKYFIFIHELIKIYSQLEESEDAKKLFHFSMLEMIFNLMDSLIYLLIATIRYV